MSNFALVLELISVTTSGTDATESPPATTTTTTTATTTTTTTTATTTTTTTADPGPCAKEWKSNSDGTGDWEEGLGYMTEEECLVECDVESQTRRFFPADRGSPLTRAPVNKDGLGFPTKLSLSHLTLQGRGANGITMGGILAGFVNQRECWCEHGMTGTKFYLTWDTTYIVKCNSG